MHHRIIQILRSVGNAGDSLLDGGENEAGQTGTGRHPAREETDGNGRDQHQDYQQKDPLEFTAAEKESHGGSPPFMAEGDLTVGTL